MTANKLQMTVTWLSNYHCQGIDFRLGDNGCQLFYEAQQRGITWLVLHPKTARYWVVIAQRKGSVKTLNCCINHWDGAIEKEPLYYKQEYEDIPTGLLESVAGYIHSGANPFERWEAEQ